MTYRLRPGLSYCQSDGRMIVLDLNVDRYFEIAPPLALAIDRLASGEPEPSPETLLERDLIRRADTPSPPIAPFTWTLPASSRLERAPLSRCRTSDVILASWALGTSITRFHASKLRRTLERLARRRLRLGQNPDGELIGLLADRFMAARRLLPASSICLRDSLALLDFLALHGWSADLVFGVQVAPFSAHCWVQSGECVLNETLHEARRHTPILAI